MNELSERGQDRLIEYLQGRELGLDLPHPFERDIFLFSTQVAGTTHVEGISEIEPKLKEGDRLIFYREPDNVYDPQTIRVETVEEFKIGYVPQQDNVIFSRLMDAGKNLFGIITEKEMRGKWLRIKMDIYLHET